MSVKTYRLVQTSKAVHAVQTRVLPCRRSCWSRRIRAGVRCQLSDAIQTFLLRFWSPPRPPRLSCALQGRQEAPWAILGPQDGLPAVGQPAGSRLGAAIDRFLSSAFDISGGPNHNNRHHPRAPRTHARTDHRLQPSWHVRLRSEFPSNRCNSQRKS